MKAARSSEISVVAKESAKPPRKRADPMAHGNRRQDALLEVHGHVGHSPAETGGAKSATFTGQADDLRVAARTADQVKTALRKDSASQIVFELAQHELR
jgi:hypothetical protein